MAIAKPHIHQPHLDHLELPGAGFNVNNYPLPKRTEIDVNEVQFIIDVDLDELTVLFTADNQPHYIDDVADKYAIMVDAQSDQVIGVVLHRFLSEAVKLHAGLIPLLRHATIIAGTSLQRPQDVTGIKGRMESWIADRMRREEKKQAFAAFADHVGIR